MAIHEVYVTNAINGIPTDASTVVLEDPTDSWGIRSIVDQTIIVPAGQVVNHDGVGLYSYDNSGNGIHALVGYNPAHAYELVWKLTQADGNTIYVEAQFPAAPTGLDFATAYNRVRDRIGKGVTTTLAAELVNEALREMANDRPWDWVKDTVWKTLNLSQGIGLYTLNDDSIKDIVAIRIEGMTGGPVDVYSYYNSDFFYLHQGTDRTQAIPRRAMRIGRDTLEFYPVPDSDYVAKILTEIDFNLTVDGEVFPCPKAFVDCIIDRACQMAAGDLGKDNLYRRYGASFKQKRSALRKARKVNKLLVPGDENFMPMGSNQDYE